MITVGTIVTALSPILLLSSKLSAAVAFICVLSIGEALWIPRLFEFTLSDVAGRGEEATYMALSFAPQHLAGIITGPMSGWLLREYCPKIGFRQSWKMWGIISAAAALTPVFLIVLRPCFRYGGLLSLADSHKGSGVCDGEDCGSRGADDDDAARDAIVAVKESLLAHEAGPGDRATAAAVDPDASPASPPSPRVPACVSGGAQGKAEGDGLDDTFDLIDDPSQALIDPLLNSTAQAGVRKVRRLSQQPWG